jgi:hypothetical protein
LALVPLIFEGRDGKERTFYYAVEVSGQNAIFRVYKYDQPEQRDDFFELRLKRCPNGVYQIDVIRGHTSEFRGVGIPDSLIPAASRMLKAAIRSSPKLDPGDGSVWRNDDADKM